MKKLLTLLVLVVLCLSSDSQIIIRGGNLSGAIVGTTNVSAPPPSDTPLITGQALNNGTFNNNQVCTGMQIVVGASPITVTSIGMWVFAGNSETHTLKIKDSSCNDIVSTSINMSGATSGQYLYGTITPTVLSAGTTYFIGFSNTADTFYSTAPVTFTSVISSCAASFQSGSSCVAAEDHNAYGPVNVLYH